MQALKVVVIGMGVLIVIGMGLLAYGVTAGFGSLGERASAKSATSAKGFGTVRARLPAGATVVESTHDGHRLSVRISLPDGGARIMIFHLGDGRQIGTIELESGR